MDNVVWYVVGDPEQLLWKTKMDAEKWARECFPNEVVDTRYARVRYTEIHTYENDTNI